MHALALPRRFHNEAHKNVTPIEAFTGQKPRWKDVQGFVMGMQCWWFREKKTRDRS
jgi:hypothetical protein